MKVEIVKIEGQDTQRIEVELTGNVLYLGRGGQKENFIPLPRCKHEDEPVLSRIHCTLMQENGDWWFVSGEPGGSNARNGCYLDGKLVEHPVRLEVGQTFVLRNPPPCTLELQVSEDPYDLEDTLTPELLSLPVPQGKVDDLEGAIAQLHEQIRQNQADDKTARAQQAALAAAVTDAAIELQDFKKQLRGQIKSSQRLARVVCWLALAIAVIGGGAFFVERDDRRQYAEIVTEILLFALGGGGLWAVNRQQQGEENGEQGFRSR